MGKAARIAAGLVWPAIDGDALRSRVFGMTALITGASSGIGAASARRLAAEGARVVLVARRAHLLEELTAEIVELGGSVLAYPTDLADIADVERLLSSLERDGHHVDIVVNCAGKSIRRSVAESADRFHDYTRTVNVNYLGPVRLLLGLLPAMRDRGRGVIVNVGTVGVDLPAPSWGAYIASKAAFEVWLWCLSPEARADGVAAASIHFPLVHTAMSAPTRLFRHLPGMDPDEAADAVCRAIVREPRLMSPLWSRCAGLFMTGARAPTDALLTLYCRLRTDRFRTATGLPLPSRLRGKSCDERVSRR